MWWSYYIILDSYITEVQICQLLYAMSILLIAQSRLNLQFNLFKMILHWLCIESVLIYTDSTVQLKTLKCKNTYKQALICVTSK